MHDGRMVVCPWPLFGDPAFYSSLNGLLKILDKEISKYQNAMMWKEEVKLLMAKLYACDWLSIDNTSILMRTNLISKLFQNSFCHGVEEFQPFFEPLRNRNDGSVIIDYRLIFEVSGEEVYEFKREIDNESEFVIQFDSDFILSRSQDGQQVSDLYSEFENKVQIRNSTKDDIKWFENFKRFVSSIIERRIRRVLEWITVNLSSFPSDNTEVLAIWRQFDDDVANLKREWEFCGMTCAKCKRKCCLLKNHGNDVSHDCTTTHICCFSCIFHENDPPKSCSLPANHDGIHVCSPTLHLCAQPCHLSDRRNCQKECVKMINHEGDHICSTQTHYCGQLCSLQVNTDNGGNTNYSCSNTCIFPYDEQHSRHKCEIEICPIVCFLPGCQIQCQSRDHFHGLTNEDVNHFCG
ncbi:hypothetical protein HK096_002476 [Nowakowskiella sp. JEL0078]|nr:hypothetical protein HK096_002476 [Nowakowskiella sp. JEL0078]